jgi:hypothetical protein
MFGDDAFDDRGAKICDACRLDADEHDGGDCAACELIGREITTRRMRTTSAMTTTSTQLRRRLATRLELAARELVDVPGHVVSRAPRLRRMDGPGCAEARNTSIDRPLCTVMDERRKSGGRRLYSGSARRMAGPISDRSALPGVECSASHGFGTTITGGEVGLLGTSSTNSGSGACVLANALRIQTPTASRAKPPTSNTRGGPTSMA